MSKKRNLFIAIGYIFLQDLRGNVLQDRRSLKIQKKMYMSKKKILFIAIG